MDPIQTVKDHWYQGRRIRVTPSGWLSGNAPCCEHNGHRPDRRSRGGLIIANDGWSYSCFNCNFRTGFKIGQSLSLKARKFLGWIGITTEDQDKINLESLRIRNLGDLVALRRKAETVSQITFKARALPENAVPLEESAPEFRAYVEARSISVDCDLYTVGTIENPGPGQRPGIVVPYTYNNQLVGYTIRYLDSRKPKYLSDNEPSYVLGIDWQRPQWQYVLVMEGVFDALSTGGLAVLHSTVTDHQAQLIRSLGKTIIVVPDQNKAGMALVDRALELGWSVSMPEWNKNCIDPNDAVCTYGLVPALYSIVESRETSRIKIDLKRKQIIKKSSTGDLC